MPLDTLRLFEDHGVIERTLPGDVSEARRTMSALAAAGISFADVNRTLEEQGIAKFTTSLQNVLAVIVDDHLHIETDRDERVRDAVIAAAITAYEDAGLSGLCLEGRWDAAVDAMRSLDLRASRSPDTCRDAKGSG